VTGRYAEAPPTAAGDDQIIDFYFLNRLFSETFSHPSNGEKQIAAGKAYCFCKCARNVKSLL